MLLTLEIPDDVAVRLGPECAKLSRRALESFAAAEYRQGRLDKPDLRRLLGLETSYEIDGFLKQQGVYDAYAAEDLEADREAIRQIRL